MALSNGKIAYTHRGPECPSGLVACSPRRRPGFASRSVGLSEINFSDLYCGWLGRIINVEYNTIQYNTIQLGRGGVGVCSVPCSWRVAGSNPPQKPPRTGPGQVLHSQLLMRFGVKLRFSVRAVVGSASEWESGRGAITSVQNTIQYNTIQS